MLNVCDKKTYLLIITQDMQAVKGHSSCSILIWYERLFFSCLTVSSLKKVGYMYTLLSKIFLHYWNRGKKIRPQSMQTVFPNICERMGFSKKNPPWNSDRMSPVQQKQFPCS